MEQSTIEIENWIILFFWLPKYPRLTMSDLIPV